MSGHPAIVTTDTVTIDDVLELARFRAACDRVGVRHDPDALIDHHRRNAEQVALMRAEQPTTPTGRRHEPPREAPADLMAALRASVEAAKARRTGGHTS